MSHFNVRVYGIIVNAEKQILVADELIKGAYYTKFPGGGLEFGEGTRECLKRELNEELGINAVIGEHIYTTDFFQRSAFNPQHQILSIYYLVSSYDSIAVPIRHAKFEFDTAQLDEYKKTGETASFRWIDRKDFTINSVSLPIDKKVVPIIQSNYF